jgi:hypothetical protein
MAPLCINALDKERKYLMNILFLLQAHSGWRYIIILILVLALLKLLIGLVAKQRWSRLDQILGAATPIVIDIQWLLGILLWIVEQRWTGADPMRSWEHPFIMTLALIAAHIGWSRAKRAPTDSAKFQSAFVGFLIAALLIGVGVARITGWM